MSTKAVFCTAREEQQVERIANSLRTAGFTGNEISLLRPDQATHRDFVPEEHSKAQQAGTTGASAGGILGGGLGWLLGLGSIAVPGAGAFLAAGPIMAALAGAAVGAAAGGLTGALVGLGIPEYEAKQYEGRILEGHTLISVQAETVEEVERATEIFKSEGAFDISHTPWEWRPGIVTLWGANATSS